MNLRSLLEALVGVNSPWSGNQVLVGAWLGGMRPSEGALPDALRSLLRGKGTLPTREPGKQLEVKWLRQLFLALRWASNPHGFKSRGQRNVVLGLQCLIPQQPGEQQDLFETLPSGAELGSQCAEDASADIHLPAALPPPYSPSLECRAPPSALRAAWLLASLPGSA